MTKTKLSIVKKEKSEKLEKPNSSDDSLAFKKITDSAQIQFPNQDIYYIYRPAKANASLLERFAAFLLLIYYKYLLHSGLYVMTKNERRIVNGIVMVSVILSTYQLLQLFNILLGY